MAVLIDADRFTASRNLIQRMFVASGATANMDLATIKAAIDAADDWADTNAAAYNAALPVAFRTTATLQQKTLLLALVICKRAGIDI